MTPNKPLTITLPARIWEKILANIKEVEQTEGFGVYDMRRLENTHKVLLDAYESAIIAAIDEEGKK